jgi:GntR family transcriptional regulator
MRKIQIPDEGAESLFGTYDENLKQLETQFGVRMVKAREKLRAVAADAASAKLLGVKTGEPLLAVDRVTSTYGERPVEWRRGLCTTKRYHYFNEIG